MSTLGVKRPIVLTANASYDLELEQKLATETTVLVENYTVLDFYSVPGQQQKVLRVLFFVAPGRPSYQGWIGKI
jgi:hypothetical protein